MRTILMLLGLYLLYKFIFDFVIPIYNTTSQVKKKVGEMQQQMNEQMQQQNNFNTTTSKHAAEKPKRDDYIDFEEVK